MEKEERGALVAVAVRLKSESGERRRERGGVLVCYFANVLPSSASCRNVASTEVRRSFGVQYVLFFPVLCSDIVVVTSYVQALLQKID